MGIKISHGFTIGSPTPIDSRMTFHTIEDMKNVNDDIMPESYVAICDEDCNIYSYNKSRDTDPVTGKFRLVGGQPAPTPIIYGMHVDGTKSNPAEAVTYLTGCDNENFTPAGMNFTTGTFSYGSWENAFFMPKPCMLKYDGTVDYYLDPNDYTKREDGTSSDVSNMSYGGNAMMEWGQNDKKIWYKIVPDPSNLQKANIYISDTCVDSGYHAWSFIGHDYQLKDHFYTAIYNSSKDTVPAGGRLRSLSGTTILNSVSAEAEIALATANGDGWYTDVFCDRVLINILLVLMGKHLAPKEVFGWGNRLSDPGFNTPGSMNTKGLFWGKKTTSTSDTSGVKVFGMENWWGNMWRRTAGLINDNGRIKYKMCLGTEDGSSTATYNVDGSGYLTTDRVPSGSSGGYISVANYTGLGVWTPITASGSETTFYEDGMWFNDNQINYALFGGAYTSGSFAGSWAVNMNVVKGFTYINFGAVLSFR